MKRLIYLSLAASILLIGASVFYYLVIFLPEQATKEGLERIWQETSVQADKEKNQQALNDCLDDVSQRFSEGVKKTEGVALTDSATKVILDLYSQQKEECFRKYPVQ